MMFGGGGSSDLPSTPPPAAAPTVADEAVQKAVAEAVRRKRMSRGYRSTILGSMAKANTALPSSANAPGKGVTVGA